MPRFRHARIAIATVLAGSAAMIMGCAAHGVMPGAAKVITITDCRADSDYYHAHAHANSGADVFRFVNHDTIARTVDFGARWPFEGLPHKIVLQPGETSHTYPIDKFGNHAALPDTFDFRLEYGPECQGPPQGPGVIVDD
jgi:hypothetical protein